MIKFLLSKFLLFKFTVALLVLSSACGIKGPPQAPISDEAYTQTIQKQKNDSQTDSRQISADTTPSKSKNRK